MDAVFIPLATLVHGEDAVRQTIEDRDRFYHEHEKARNEEWQKLAIQEEELAGAAELLRTLDIPHDEEYQGLSDELEKCQSHLWWRKMRYRFQAFIDLICLDEQCNSYIKDCRRKRELVASSISQEKKEM